MGRPSHKPDAASRRQVEALAGYGVREEEIGDFLRLDPKTLRKHYRQELKQGHTKANAKVAENLYRRAHARLRSGDFEGGWRDHEARWQARAFLKTIGTTAPIPSSCCPHETATACAKHRVGSGSFTRALVKPPPPPRQDDPVIDWLQDGVAFYAVEGSGFNYPAYREGVLGEVFRRYYNIPAWLPMTSCPFCERYCGQVRCPR